MFMLSIKHGRSVTYTVLVVADMVIPSSFASSAHRRTGCSHRILVIVLPRNPAYNTMYNGGNNKSIFQQLLKVQSRAINLTLVWYI
ncbi:hypothetical protein F5Y04DRAFT_260439 [Hypomontagnella monticulosa]|nr:hypothetical protein F5Y04DRAFT_260439 [Hypomontagnella monticulosa]